MRYVEKPVSDGDPAGTTISRTVTHDEGIRADSTAEKLGKLKPVFKADGTSTAGNSSPINDGASAVTLARRDVAERLGLKPIGRFIGTSVVGVPPRIMGELPTSCSDRLMC